MAKIKSLVEMQQQADNFTNKMVNPKEMLQLEMLTSFEKYTKAMFKAQYKRSFIVAEHHKKMFEALQNVVDGKCRRLIINIAPRYGKCVSKNTLITLATGKYKKIGDILPGDKVLSFRNGKAVVNSVIATEPAYKECYKITMKSGRSVVCSTDHPWRTPFGYIKSNELRICDMIFALKVNLSHESKYPYSIIINEGLSDKIANLELEPIKPFEYIPEDIFKKLVGIFPNNLAKYWAEDFYLDEIADIKEVGKHELIHIEVENDHNFIANGLVSHNTELVIKSFISWCFALNPKCRFLHLSYSDILVYDNSETIRNIMQEDLYKTLFPRAALASEKGSAKRWKTKAGGELYAVSTQGQVTGFGAGAVDIDPEIDKLDGGNNVFVFDDHTNEVLSMIGAQSNVFQGAIVIDDPIKPEDAESDIVRERINMRFENTIRNRTNSRNTPIIIIMQRLHEHDLCGYLQEIEPDEWTVLSLPVIQVNPETGEEHALWPMKHTLEELYRMRDINPLVFDTQYMQDPAPKEGLMYEGFRTYRPEELPTGTRALQKWNYTDTADTGADSLASICFINTPEYVYVTDVLFTDAPMEVTERKQAELLAKNQTVDCLIESNNGGRGYARNVKRILRTDMRNFKCAIRTFTQSENKKTRIFTASAQVQNDIVFPEGWEKKWPKFYKALMSYRKDNKKNSHDDAPDALTGVWEMHSRKGNRRKIRRRN